MTTATREVTINLREHPDCLRDEGCDAFAYQLYYQLSSGRYTYPVSVLRLDDMAAWCAQHRTARKRALRAAAHGYTFAEFERAEFEEDIYAINTSLPERQGRPMSQGYLERLEYQPLPYYPCQRHAIYTLGVISPDAHLVAYLVAYVAGDLMMVSQVLGHGDHLKNDVMYLLMRDAFEWLPRPLVVFYNRHDSGTDGLRYFKERLGFKPERAEWRA